MNKESKESKIYKENNHIYFYAEVNRENASTLLVLFREAEEYSIVNTFRLRVPEIPIYLHIFSDGGELHSTFSIIDAINRSKVNIYSVIDGSTCSAGVLISISCKKRYICPSAYILLHQLSSDVSGKMNEMRDEIEHLSDLSDKIIEIYEKHSSMTVKKINKLLKHELWLNSEIAIKYGLVDELFS